MTIPIEDTASGVSQDPRVSPVRPGERIVFMDTLRGFAVLGILLANIPFMALARASSDMDLSIAGKPWADIAGWAVVYLFADTKFITLFSVLFGIGLGMMSEKALAAGAPFVGRYTRRLFVLFLFGAAHVALFWFGDILMIYAFCGFLALWFRKRRIKALLWVAGILLVLSWLEWGLTGLMDPNSFVDQREGMSIEETLEADAADMRETFSTGGIAAQAERRISTYVEFVPFLVFFFGPRTLALFLIGIAIAKSGFLSHLESHRASFRRMVVPCVTLGLLLCGVAAFLKGTSEVQAAGVAEMAFLFLGGLVLATGYFSLLALWSMGSHGHGLRMRLAAVGRMALTNYILHSVITSLVFNWLGFYDQLRRPALLLVVFAIFLAQLWFSPIWLRHFRYGPLEWLWRMATYVRTMPIRG